MKSKHLWKQGIALALAAALLLGGISPMEASAAWQRNNIGWWWQQDGGGYPTSSWQLINGTWYYFDEAGYMVEGWLQLDDTWYYLNPGSGAMAEGWLQLDGTWYYLNPGSGAMAEGWLQLGDTWYYLNPGSGAMAEGWLQLGDTWYYLNPGSGAMAANTYIGDYYLDASGAWVQEGSQSNTSSTGATWVKSGNLWWYRHADGGYTANGWEQINGGWYYFDNAGWMVTDWRQIGGDWYYFGSDGAMKTSQWVGDYYVGADGIMATDQVIDGYYVGADGKWIPDVSNNDVPDNEASGNVTAGNNASGNGSADNNATGDNNASGNGTTDNNATGSNNASGNGATNNNATDDNDASDDDAGDDESPMPPIGLVKSDYYYNQLTAEEKGIYDILLNGICNLKPNISINTTDVDVCERALDALENDRCYYYWTKWGRSISYGSKKITVSFAYTMTKDERDAIQTQIDSKVDSLLNGVSMADSDYDKAKAVFDALVNNVEYGYDGYDAHIMLGALINGKAVCDGYTKATQYMLNKLGIQCISVSGRADNGDGDGYCDHAWNIARLDGKYYHIDTTWGNSIDYNCLCATDEEFFRSRILDGPIFTCESSFTVPKCTSTDLDFYRMNGGYFETWDPDAIGNYIHSKYLSGEKKAGIKLANKELYDQTFDYYLNRGNMLRYCPELKEYTVSINSIKFYTLTFNFE